MSRSAAGHEIAHFFWHGRPLSLYESACIVSFVRRGFSANLWCFDPLDVPPGVVRRDAAEVLPRADLGKYTQGGMKANIPAFADAFRFTLLSREPGWWFDTDLVCLRSAADFADLAVGKKIVCAREDDEYVASGILLIPDPAVQRSLMEELKNSGTEFDWGHIGPRLLTRVLTRLGLRDMALPPSTFLPIDYRKPEVVLLPDEVDAVARLCSTAFTCHLWNEVLRRYEVPKDVLPPEGSWLHREFISLLPELVRLPCLQVAAVKALVPGPGITRRMKTLLSKLLRGVERR